MKLLILDIDGVLTDGKKYYSASGVELKQFNDKDFTAIKRFIAAGVKVIFLSGDENINKQMAQNRNIPFYFARKNKLLSKAAFIAEFEAEFDIKKNDMAYVGDDLFDLDIIQELKLTFCPLDAINDIKENCLHILNKNGGDGVIADLYNHCVYNKIIYPASYSTIVQIDSNEKY